MSTRRAAERRDDKMFQAAWANNWTEEETAEGVVRFMRGVENIVVVYDDQDRITRATYRRNTHVEWVMGTRDPSKAQSVILQLQKALA